MSEKQINPSKVLYIKLGSKGMWEHECIYNTHSLKFGYIEVTHINCINKNWKDVSSSLESIRSSKGAITRDVNQIKEFYEAGEDVLWITFHENCLWWCFSKSDVILESDNRKTRQVIGRWSSTDIQGNKLTSDKLRGSLVSIQGYQGTICSVKDSKYLINKINCIIDPDLKKAEDAYQEIKQHITNLIKKLHPKDFEVLMDLIFRQAGWQRISKIGENQKTIDLELISPISDEKYCVQIKSRSNKNEYEEYKKRFEDMEEYTRFYYVVHSPSQDLEHSEKECKEEKEIQLMFCEKISYLAIKYGLIDWIMDKF